MPFVHDNHMILNNYLRDDLSQLVTKIKKSVTFVVEWMILDFTDIFTHYNANYFLKFEFIGKCLKINTLL